MGTADFAVLLDGGWVRDPLLLMTQVDGMIRNSLSELNATVPIIVSCTSISQFFTDVEGLTHTEFSNRELVDQLIANNNRRTIIYGDWGSTRPRTYGIASRPLPRIDYPTRQSWIFARNKAKGWDFDDAAKEIVESDVWKKNYGLGVWGEQMIEQTCINPALGINSPQKNVASRVNIHLHRQAFYDIANFVDLNLDEDWEDD